MHNTNTFRRVFKRELQQASENYIQDPSPMNRARMFIALEAVNEADAKEASKARR